MSDIKAKDECFTVGELKEALNHFSDDSVVYLDCLACIMVIDNEYIDGSITLVSRKDVFIF